VYRWTKAGAFIPGPMHWCCCGVAGVWISRSCGESRFLIFFGGGRKHGDVNTKEPEKASKGNVNSHPNLTAIPNWLLKEWAGLGTRIKCESTGEVSIGLLDRCIRGRRLHLRFPATQIIPCLSWCGVGTLEQTDSLIAPNWQAASTRTIHKRSAIRMRCSFSGSGLISESASKTR
jgi:hypothetical protein